MPEFYFFLLVGGFLIVLEVLVGFVAFWFFIFGLACILTALSVLVYPGWEPALGFFAGYTIVATAVFFKFFRQKLVKSSKESWHDLVGQMLEVQSDILPGSQGGKVRWSGVDWKARMAPGHEGTVIRQGGSVVVSSISGTTLFVQPPDTAAAPVSDPAATDAPKEPAAEQATKPSPDTAATPASDPAATDAPKEPTPEQATKPNPDPESSQELSTEKPPQAGG